MKYTNVSEYINSLEGDGKQAVSDFAARMAARFPALAPRISFSMPMWYLGEKMYEGYVAVSAAKNYFSVHIYDQSVVEGLKSRDLKCKYGKGCVNIPYHDPDSLATVWDAVCAYVDGVPKEKK